MIAWIVLGIILLVLGIIIFSAVRVSIRFFADEKGLEFRLSARYLVLEFLVQKSGENMGKFLVIHIFGWKIRKKFSSEKKEAKQEEEQEEKELKKEDERSLSEKLEKIQETYLRVKDDIISILRYFTKKLKFDRFWVVSQIGLDDAPSTALAAGMFYMLIMPVSTLICHNFSYKDMKIEANPCYNENVLSLHCDIAMRIRVSNLVILAVKVLKLVRKAIK